MIKSYTENPKLKTILSKDQWKGTPLDEHGRYINLWHPLELTVKMVIKWKLSRNPYAAEKQEEKKHYSPTIIKDSSWLTSTDDCFVWLGHASFFMRINGYTFLTDPVLGRLFSNCRYTKLPVDKNQLKGIDYILLSHDHTDHIDKNSLKHLARLNPKVQYLTGLSNDRLIQKYTNSQNIQAAGWYQQFNTPTDIEIYYLPTRHWCKRSLCDTNKRLWGAFVIKTNDKIIYLGGDSAYDQHYTDAQKIFGHFDYCILGIGAYMPRWMMEGNHNSPDDALQAFFDLNGTTMIPIHYGTFDLSDEPLSNPIKVLLESARNKGVESKIKNLAWGECLSIL
jgi:L-ascorbate metabolism protein UlaG (beta-lactamase superfamily)